MERDLVGRLSSSEGVANALEGGYDSVTDGVSEGQGPSVCGANAMDEG